MTDPGGHAGTCVIMGAGSAGLFFLQDALHRGFQQVIVSDKQESRLRIARELGAHTVRVPDEELASVAPSPSPVPYPSTRPCAASTTAR